MRQRSLLALGLLTAPAFAGAATFKVNNTQDIPDATPGDGICSVSKTLDPNQFALCTLRAAIMEGNATPTSQAVDIQLKPGAHYRITIPEQPNQMAGDGSGDFNIRRQMTIATPPLAQRAIVDGNGISRVFKVDHNGPGSTIANVIIKGGLAESAPAVHAIGAVKLVNADISMNFRTPGQGATYAIRGRVSLFDSQVRLNGTTAQPVGGVLVHHSSRGIIITGSTIHHNSGAGLQAEEIPVIIENSAVSSNLGAGVHAINTDLDIVFSTIANNTAGESSGRQLFFSSSANSPNTTLTMTGSIINAHGSGKACEIDQSTLFLSSWNIYSDASCLSDTFLDNSLHNQQGTIDVSLSNAGGPTLVHLPKAGSVVIDRAPASICDALATDQRGFDRPVAADGVSESRCDIGAVEVQP